MILGLGAICIITDRIAVIGVYSFHPKARAYEIYNIMLYDVDKLISFKTILPLVRKS